MNEMITVFTNKQFGKVRMIEIDGIPYFVGKDVAKSLGYSDTNKAIAMHVDDDDKLNDKTALSLGQRGGWLITESGVYSLIFSSQLPEAKTFKRWVTTEVLPSIRKTGSYTMPQDGLYINGHYISLDEFRTQGKIGELARENAKLYKQNKELKRDVKLLGGKLGNPTLEEVEAYAKKCNIDIEFARKFFYYYDSLGWVAKKISIKSWRSRLQLWWMQETETRINNIFR